MFDEYSPDNRCGPNQLGRVLDVCLEATVVDNNTPGSSSSEKRKVSPHRKGERLMLDIQNLSIGPHSEGRRQTMEVIDDELAERPKTSEGHHWENETRPMLLLVEDNPVNMRVS